MAAITLDIGGNTRQLDRDIQKTVNRVYNINLQTKGSQPLGRITGQVNEFTKSLDASNARVIAFGASAGLIYGLQRAFGALVSSTIEVQKSLQDINVILNVSTSQLNKFGSELFNIAKNTGQSFDEVAKAATEFSRQGLGVEETLKRTSDALILSRLSGLDAAKSVEALTAAVNSFANEAVTASEVVNKFANVDAAFAVSSADLAEAISRVGSSAAQSGVSLNELIAIVTSAQQTTARGGAVIGNSFKTIFTRLQRGKVLDLLESLGISTTDSSGQLKSTIQLLQDLGRVYDTLGQKQQAAVAEKVGGVFQINILKAALADLGKEYSIYNSALNTAANSTDQAIQRNQELNKTYASQINALQENAKQLAAAAGERILGPSIDRLVGGSNAILGGLNAEDGKGFGAQLGKGILDGIGQFISGPGLVLIGGVLLKLFKDLAKFATGSVQQLLGLNTSATQQKDLQQSINQILQKNPQLIDLALQGTQGLNAAASQLLANLQKQTIELQKQEAISAQLAKTFVQSGVRMSGGVPMAPTPGKTTKTGKAAGYIPNFVGGVSKRDSFAETMAAYQAGYKPGQVSKVDGKIYNKAESVVQFPGAKDRGIVPPKDSPAGKQYQKDFKKIAGYDPYEYMGKGSAKGFIPNFIMPTGKDIVSTGAPKRISKDTRKRSELFRKYGYLVPPGGGNGFLPGLGDEFPDKAIRVREPKLQNVNTQAPELQLQKNISDAIAKNAVAFTNTLKPLGRTVGEQEIKKSLETTAGAKGAVSGAVGAAFETAISKALDYKAAQQEGGDFDVRGGKNLKLVQELFGISVPLADFKVSTSDDARSSFYDKIRKEEALKTGNAAEQKTSAENNARKQAFNELKASNPEWFTKKGDKFLSPQNFPGGEQAYKQSQERFNKRWQRIYRRGFATGYVPNFSALQDAINRERQAGVSNGRIYVAQDRRLAASGYNPLGLGVFNTRDEPTSGARSRAIKSRGYASGYIPNFAIQNQDTEAASITTILATIGTELSSLAFAFAFTKDEYKKSLSEITQANRLAGKVTGEMTRAQKVATLELVKSGKITREEGIRRIQEGRFGATGGQKVGSFLSNNAFGLSIAAPIIGETVKNLAGDQTKTRRGVGSIGSAIGQIGGFAATGAMIAGPGPQAALGAAIGGVVGAALSAGDVIDSFVSDFPEFQKAADQATKELNKFNESSSKMVQAAEKYQALLDRGVTNVDVLNKAQTELANSLKDIPVKYQAELLKSVKQGNFTEVQGQIGSQLQTEVNLKQAQAGRQKIVDDVRKGSITKNITSFFDKTAFRGLAIGKNLIEDIAGGRMPSRSTLRGRAEDINPTAEAFTKTTISGLQNRENAKADFVNAITKGQTTEQSVKALQNIKLPTVFTKDFTEEGKKAASEIFTGIETPEDFGKFLKSLKNVEGGQALSDIDIKQWLEMAKDGELGLATAVGLFNDSVTEGIPQYQKSIQNAKELAAVTAERNKALEAERSATDAALKSLQTNVAITNTWRNALDNFSENARKFQEDLRISNQYTAPKEALGQIFQGTPGITGISNLEKKYEVGGKMATIRNDFTSSVNEAMNEFKSSIRDALGAPFEDQFNKVISDLTTGQSYEGVQTKDIAAKGAAAREQAGKQKSNLDQTMTSMESLMQEFVNGQITTESFQKQSVSVLQRVGIGVDASKKVGDDIQMAVAQSGTKLLMAAQVAQQQRKLLATEQVQKAIQEKIQQALGVFGGISGFMNRPTEAPFGEFKKVEPILDKIREIRSSVDFRYSGPESVKAQKEKTPELARKYIELYQNFNQMSGGAFRGELQKRIDAMDKTGQKDISQGRGGYVSQTGGFDDIVRGIKDDLEAQLKQYEDQIKVEKDPGIKKDLQTFVDSIKGVGLDKVAKLQAMAATGIARQSDYEQTYGQYENAAIESLKKQFPGLAGEISKGVGFGGDQLLQQAQTQSALQAQMVNFLGGIQSAIVKTAQGKVSEIQAYNPEEIIKQMAAGTEPTGQLQDKKPAEFKPVDLKAKNMDDRFADYSIRAAASQGQKLPSVEQLKQMYPDYTGYMSTESQKLMGPKAVQDATKLSQQTAKPIEKSISTQEASLSQNTTAITGLTTAINGLQTSLKAKDVENLKQQTPANAEGTTGTKPQVNTTANAPVNIVVNAQNQSDISKAIGEAVQKAIPTIIEKVRIALGEKVPPSTSTSSVSETSNG